MSDAHRRPKTPEQTRRALLDAAAAQGLAYGLSALSLPTVAEAAGVTKGAVFHHFGSKQGLIDALCTEILARIDRDIEAALAADPPATRDTYGCFTRAYVRCTFGAGDHSSPWSALSLSAITDPALALIWAGWIGGRLARHAATDTDPGLDIVRLAADGYWLSRFQGTEPADSAALCRQLLAMASPPARTGCAS